MYKWKVSEAELKKTVDWLVQELNNVEPIGTPGHYDSPSTGFGLDKAVLQYVCLPKKEYSEKEMLKSRPSSREVEQLCEKIGFKEDDVTLLANSERDSVVDYVIVDYHKYTGIIFSMPIKDGEVTLESIEFISEIRYKNCRSSCGLMSIKPNKVILDGRRFPYPLNNEQQELMELLGELAERLKIDNSKIIYDTCREVMRFYKKRW
jgi:hypothetical protein